MQNPHLHINTVTFGNLGAKPLEEAKAAEGELRHFLECNGENPDVLNGEPPMLD